MVIIASSGMCEAGRIRHHLRHVVSDPDNAIVIVSYQAEGTLGRQISEGVERIQIFDQWYDLNAAVYVLDGFSGHADRNDLAWWYEQTGGNIEHGVPRPRRARLDRCPGPRLAALCPEPGPYARIARHLRGLRAMAGANRDPSAHTSRIGGCAGDILGPELRGPANHGDDPATAETRPEPRALVIDGEGLPMRLLSEVSGVHPHRSANFRREGALPCMRPRDTVGGCARLGCNKVEIGVGWGGSSRGSFPGRRSLNPKEMAFHEL